MRRHVPLLSLVGALMCCAGVITITLTQGCSSSSTDTTPAATTDASTEEGPRVLACAPATDAGVAKAIEAGVTAKIIQPTNGQIFTTTDKVTFQGTGSDLIEGAISDKTRMIWNIGDINNPAKGPAPDGEGPEDTAGPYPAGTYILRFDVSNKACETAADSVLITIK